MSEHCTNCGSVVSDRFARVAGDNNNEVHHCHSCISETDGGRALLRRGAAAYKDIENAKRNLL